MKAVPGTKFGGLSNNEALIAEDATEEFVVVHADLIGQLLGVQRQAHLQLMPGQALVIERGVERAARPLGRVMQVEADVPRARQLLFAY
jgi:hypothetical protein